LGITSLTRPDYGLSLTLGGGEVSLLELTQAYAVFANNGRRMPPVAITKVVDFTGSVVYEYQPPAGDQVMRAEHAYLISSILSDNQARSMMFGTDSVLALPFPVAAKTGTTNDFRDNWTMGYTPDLAVGVWVGNADYTPMENTTGLSGAAPIWAKFMEQAAAVVSGGNSPGFSRPAGIVDRVICKVSGTEPSEWCTDQSTEIYAADQLPLSADNDLWKKARIDTWSGLLASADCSDFVEEKFAINTYGDPWANRWLKETDQGRSWAESLGFEWPVFIAPTRACESSDPHADLKFTAPIDGQTITINPLEIFAMASGRNDHRLWRLEYGLGDDPQEWFTLVGDTSNNVSQPEKIYVWDLKDIPAGTVTLKLYLESTEDTYAERRIHINLQVPTPTPTPTPTATTTPTVTPTPTPTQTLPPPTSTPTSPPPPADTETPTTSPG
jgi:membrane peptidoglycan carboxypeptidase